MDPSNSIDALTVVGGCLVPDATLSTIDERCDIRLGWSEELDASWRDYRAFRAARQGDAPRSGVEHRPAQPR